jgi:outer membrane beta-barrel protein
MEATSAGRPGEQLLVAAIAHAKVSDLTRGEAMEEKATPWVSGRAVASDSASMRGGRGVERTLRRVLAAALAALCVAAALLWAAPAQAQCVDEALKEQLIGRRAYRGVVPRLFKKALRHELSAMGGWYAADIADGAPVYGGAYTFHLSEYLGLEASYFRTEQRYAFLQSIVDRNQSLVGITEVDEDPVQLFLGHLVWSLAYGKVRWMGGGISRFDFYVSLGAGATHEPGSLGITGSGGFGLKFYLLEWLALRLDARDHVRSQERVALGIDKVVNDISLMGGLSVFFPFKS